MNGFGAKTGIWDGAEHLSARIFSVLDIFRWFSVLFIEQSLYLERSPDTVVLQCGRKSSEGYLRCWSSFDSHKIKLQHFLKIYEGIYIFRQRDTEKKIVFCQIFLQGLSLDCSFMQRRLLPGLPGWPRWHINEDNETKRKIKRKGRGEKEEYRKR
jgi:hypothetical protein